MKATIIRTGETLRVVHERSETTTVTRAELVAMADRVLSGHGETRTHPLTLNLLAAGVLAFAAEPKKEAGDDA
jgi:hypothetical protein